ncbi:hypothetical protein BHE74_00017177 [Ensete ventricosum]|nr:hypothetical protein GW17_00009161 [Ensete ventricosum]RWW74858.1 hypothetical protein BHE74_00017177 [Ensete ventricosum]RZR96930.1 hypothetical protein BHM03_00026050 [Ensete ventricosum]
MGCVSSKPLAENDLDRGIFYADGVGLASDCPNHVVSLTSTTYGVLNLDRSEPHGKKCDAEEAEEVIKRECRRYPPSDLTIDRFDKSVAKEVPSEVIDARELMEDLADETPFWTPLKKPGKLHASKVSASPKKQIKKALGKENAPLRRDLKSWDLDSNRILRPFSSSDNAKRMGLAVQTPCKNSLTDAGKASGRDPRGSVSRRSLSPFFDPELVASLEREYLQEGEQIKKMVPLSPRNRKAHDSSFLLRSYQEKCPPGGQNTVVLYTTTLRGIRKTFEDCNAVRSTLESYHVRIMERDISMDSGYREELRSLMGSKEAKVPAAFVRGRLIGGTEEVLRLEDEGKLELLLEGIPRAASSCEGCSGLRFIMCMDCSGSCKVLDEAQKKMVKCGVCNENGLIHCPICC